MPPDITELAPTAPKRPDSVLPRKTSAGGGWWRGLAGSLTAGLVVLAGVVTVSAVIAWVNGSTGPPSISLIGHITAAAIAIIAQRLADRARRKRALFAAAVVLVTTFGTLLLFWWR